jgi:hypothetical protein
MHGNMIESSDVICVVCDDVQIITEVVQRFLRIQYRQYKTCGVNFVISSQSHRIFRNSVCRSSLQG